MDCSGEPIVRDYSEYFGMENPMGGNSATQENLDLEIVQEGCTNLSLEDRKPSVVDSYRLDSLDQSRFVSEEDGMNLSAENKFETGIQNWASSSGSGLCAFNEESYSQVHWTNSSSISALVYWTNSNIS